MPWPSHLAAGLQYQSHPDHLPPAGLPDSGLCMECCWGRVTRHSSQMTGKEPQACADGGECCDWCWLLQVAQALGQELSLGTLFAGVAKAAPACVKDQALMAADLACKEKGMLLCVVCQAVCHVSCNMHQDAAFLHCGILQHKVTADWQEVKNSTKAWQPQMADADAMIGAAWLCILYDSRQTKSGPKTAGMQATYMHEGHQRNRIIPAVQRRSCCGKHWASRGPGRLLSRQQCAVPYRCMPAHQIIADRGSMCFAGRR